MPHILDPITPEELQITARLVKNEYDQPLVFKVVDILEPEKKLVLAVTSAERAGATPPTYSRITFAYYRIDGDEYLWKAIVDASHKRIVKITKQPHGVQGPFNYEEMDMVEKKMFALPEVKAEIEKLKLPPGYKVTCDPWIYGTDDAKETRGLIQFYMYILQVDHPESNYYSLPLKFSPVVELATGSFVRMDYLPGGDDFTIEPTQAYKTRNCVEFHPDLNGLKEREDLKPYIVQQPEGASFTVEGRLVKWQKWEFRVGFNYREGAVLYDIHYDGRPIMYRVSLCEMTVPYGDPRPPYHRKQAFDLGDVGFGIAANSLKLGCHCLGLIKYFDGYISSMKGEPVLKESAICMHEADAGSLAYVHQNYRTQGSVVTRKRDLIIQTISTLANYEYIVKYVFDQAGGFDIEVLATGILSTMPIDDNTTVPWGTIVGDGVMAAYHQHMLSFRLDPMVDGPNNTVSFQETVPLAHDAASNPYSVGYVTQTNYVDKPGAIDQNPMAHREFFVVNENVINPLTKKPVGYKIQMPTAQMLLASPSSYNTKRAMFGTRPYWVTKFKDDELYAAGEFTNQSQGDSGLSSWAFRDENVRNDDVVLWVTMGFTHNPRPEDFPVMPVEIHKIHVRPSHFFTYNPGLDVPQSKQSFNKSVLVPNESSASDACCSHSKM